MTAKFQGYHVTALATSLPAFFLRECEHLLAYFILLADVSNLLIFEPSRNLATALWTSFSPTCYAGGREPIDSDLFNPYAASLDATVESCCVFNISLSCAVAAEDRAGDIISDCNEGNWDLASFGREAVMCLETGFDKMAEAIFAIGMLAGNLDELIDGQVVAAAYAIFSGWRCLDGKCWYCRLPYDMGATDICCRGLRILD